jgi:hypothetical protein
MSWSGLASNQMVTFTNAQTSGAALKSGQSHVTSNQCMTRLDIVTKYNVNVNILLCADNQLAPKSLWEITVYQFGFSAGYSTGADACSFAEPIIRTRYTNTANPTIGTIIYTDLSLTLPLNGGSSWYQANGTMYGSSWQINSSGEIIGIYNCMF